MKALLPDKVYDFLKWFALIALPALGIFYTVIAETWGLPFGGEVQTTLNALGVLIGTLIAVSTSQLKKNN